VPPKVRKHSRKDGAVYSSWNILLAKDENVDVSFNIGFGRYAFPKSGYLCWDVADGEDSSTIFHGTSGRSNCWPKMTTIGTYTTLP